MTIAIAVRTSSAVVFAADSTVTTSGVVGVEQDGSPRIEKQTYGNATKVVHDRNRRLMAMLAGPVNIGQISALDFLSSLSGSSPGSIEAQDEALRNLVEAMVGKKREYWETTKTPEEDWPGPTILIAVPSAGGLFPRIWRIDLNGPAAETEEILTSPGIRLEGSYGEVFGLLYGYEPRVLGGALDKLGVTPDAFNKALAELPFLRPVEKLDPWAMPIQDAVDFAPSWQKCKCRWIGSCLGRPPAAVQST